MHSCGAGGGPNVTGVKYRVIKFYFRRELNAAALSYGVIRGGIFRGGGGVGAL